jgi:hypothetical protein
MQYHAMRPLVLSSRAILGLRNCCKYTPNDGFFTLTLRAGRPRFDSWQEQWIFLFATGSRSALGPIGPPMQWLPEGSFPGGKAAGAWGWSLTSI